MHFTTDSMTYLVFSRKRTVVLICKSCEVYRVLR